jgi:hypothetical protein
MNGVDEGATKARRHEGGTKKRMSHRGHREAQRGEEWLVLLLFLLLSRVLAGEAGRGLWESRNLEVGSRKLDVEKRSIP